MKKLTIVAMVVMAVMVSMAFANGKKEVKPVTNNPMKEMVYTAEQWKTVDVQVVKEKNTATTVWHKK